MYQSAIAVRDILGQDGPEAAYHAVPRVTFTDPELAHVGLSDEQAREKHGDIRVLRWGYQDNDRAQADGATRGHIKVITDPKGLILGATIVGAAAGEQIAVPAQHRVGAHQQPQPPHHVARQPMQQHCQERPITRVEAHLLLAQLAL